MIFFGIGDTKQQAKRFSIWKDCIDSKLKGVYHNDLTFSLGGSTLYLHFTDINNFSKLEPKKLDVKVALQKKVAATTSLLLSKLSGGK